MVTFSNRNYLIAVLQALFVTVLWSSSWVIIKFGLEEMPPLYYAALRYLIGSVLVVLVVFTNPSHREKVKLQNKSWWFILSLYGLFFITFTQGGQFLALSLLPAITVSFLLNLTPYLVVILSIPILKEKPSFFEILFFFIALIGILIYFFPFNFESTSIPGILIGLGLVLVNALSSIMGRSINREDKTHPVIITAISMSIGTVFLILAALIFESLPVLSLTSWIMIIWLGVVNTALAFTIWNKAMQRIRAMDISIINSTMFPQIILLSIIFLDELPLMNEWIGLIILVIATFILQVNRARLNNSSNKTKN
jgi:drug/metabolite transporter (DMT)-like permease